MSEELDRRVHVAPSDRLPDGGLTRAFVRMAVPTSERMFV